MKEEKDQPAVAPVGEIRAPVSEARVNWKSVQEEPDGTSDGKDTVSVGKNERTLRTKLLTAIKTLHDEGAEAAKFSTGELAILLSETSVEEFMWPKWNQLLMRALDGSTKVHRKLEEDAEREEA